MEDSQIIELYWNRDENAIAQTLSKYGPYCNTIANNILQDEQDSEECVNDTCMHAWQAIPPTRPAILRAFLARITRNLALDRYRRAHRTRRGADQFAVALEELNEIIASDQDVAAGYELKELTKAITDFLSALPEEKRTIFLQRYWYVCPISRIAQLHHAGESSIKMTLLRLRTQLHDYLKEHELI